MILGCGRDGRETDCAQLAPLLDTPRRYWTYEPGTDPKLLVQARWRDPAIARAAAAYAAELARPPQAPGDGWTFYTPYAVGPGSDNVFTPRPDPRAELERLCGRQRDQR